MRTALLTPRAAPQAVSSLAAQRTLFTDITAKLVEVEGIITPSDKNVAFHLNKWSKDGLAARVDEKGQFLKEEAPPAEKKEEAKSKEVAKKK